MSIAICSAGFGFASDMVIIPLVTALQNDFPAANELLFSFVISGNAIVAMVFGLSTAFLMKFFRKKTLLIFGLMAFLIGGVGGYFCNSLQSLAILRSIDAASDGILTVTQASLIIDLWREEKEQNSIFALAHIIPLIFGTLFSIVAGYAAQVNWHYAFLSDAVVIIPLVLCIIFIPKNDISKGVSNRKEVTTEVQSNVSFKPFIFALIVLVYICAQSINYSIAMLQDVYIFEQNIGNSVLTGYMSLVTLVTGITSDLSTISILPRFKKKQLFATLYLLIMASAFVIFSVNHGVIGMIIATILNYISNTWMNIYFKMYAARSIPRNRQALCIGILSQVAYISTALCTLIPSVTAYLFKTETIAQCCGICAIILTVFAAIFAVAAMTAKKADYQY